MALPCHPLVAQVEHRVVDREHRALRDSSEVYSLNPAQDGQIKELIDAAGKEGDTLGGILEVRVEGLPFGLGTHAQWDRKLDGRIAQAVMADPQRFALPMPPWAAISGPK